ncbi:MULTISPECIES: translation factor GTPase family protein [unclassified Ruminococcus]|uniref:elongation factor G n=1 Tax=unclassified Ruminococcus TaxID=2608920 RepID=UPI00210A3245|nr:MULTISPECIES: elongation factor G [unclassified Ruminococcus]MCQ4021447.1 elongation factor G [Ruminococcus sp. zg-924]MCQ4113892.1 elongation factor G [Ruminococcus sp. zg-921]
MKQYEAKKILNIAIAGHSGSGKTSVAEAMLYVAGANDRLGKISDGNTVLDCDPEEIKRKASIVTAVAPLEWKNYKINLIDTPGLFDFEGGLREGMRAADTAMIVVSGKSGVNVGTEKAVKAATDAGLTKVFFVNGLCDESARFYRVFETLKAQFGPSVCPVVVPYIVDGQANCYINLLEYKAYLYENGKMTQTAMPDMGDRLEGLRTAINEAVAETSDEMFEKYFSGEEFTPEEIIVGVSHGIKNGTISPVFCGDAQNTFGIDQLLNGIIWLAPNAADKSSELALDPNGEPVELAVNDNAATAALVFKTVADPFVGKLSYFKVISGKVSPELPLVNMRTGESERINKVLIIKGKKQEEVPYVGAGDIGAVAKLQNTKTGDTLCSPARKVVLEKIDYPTPCYSMAIYPKTKGEEDKVAQAVMKIMEEDPTITLTNNKETKQMIVSGLGEQHLDVLVAKVKTKYGVDVLLEEPKVAYRETIRKKVQAQGRHKKQSGGHGQFGDVWIEFEPFDCEDLEFAERVVGGAVPKGYFPAVEKGLRESIKKGVLAGYPVVGIKATLYDGSYHPVDSSEMSFKTAASIAYKNGLPNANPTLLEPIGTLKAVVPDGNMGDIMGEVNKRRGRVLGMNPAEGGMQIVEAEVPMAEMHDFATYIRQVTQGRGSFTFDFVRYEDVPAHIAQKIIESAKSE